MANVIRELVTKFAFDADVKEVTEFSKQIFVLAKRSRIAVLAFSSLAVSAVGFSNSAAKAGNEVAKTARRIGLGVKELQEYRFALGQLGVDQATVDRGMGIFVKTLGKVADTGKGPAADAMKRLGISLLDDNQKIRQTEEIFREILGAIGSLNSEAEKSSFASTFFGRPGQSFTLAGDIQEIDRLVMRFNELQIGISDVNAEISERFIDSMTELKKIITGIKNEIGFSLIPVVEKTTNRFKEWYIENRKLISLRLKFFIQPLTSAFEAIVFVVDQVISAYKSLDYTSKGLIAALSAYAIGLIAPWLPAILIVGLFLLILDDVVNFFKGNDSVIGEVIEGWRVILAEIVDLLNKIPGVDIKTKRNSGLSDELLTDDAVARLKELGAISDNRIYQPNVFDDVNTRQVSSDVVQNLQSPFLKSISVDSTVNVSLPGGTSEEVQKSARESARIGAIEGLERVLREAQNEFPIME